MNYATSPRMVTRATKTSALTNSDCPGLTEIKDVRVRNNLLEEIFNVEDSIELDYFELERQEANFGSYLPGYSSPSYTRLSLELKLEDTVPGKCKGFGVEGNAYHLQELQNRRTDGKDSATDVGHPKVIGRSVTRPGAHEKSGCELAAVASPTISSTCEGGAVGQAVTGVSTVPSDSPTAVAVTDSSWVHSTTNAVGIDSAASADNRIVAEKIQQCIGERSSGSEKPLMAITPAVQGYGTRANVRPRVESHSRNNNNKTSQQTVSECLSPTVDISGSPLVPVSSSGGLAAGGDSTAASSSSTSPSQLHVTKRQRVIDCGSDLLAEVRQAYEYVQGADLYAPSSHPTFTNLDITGVPSPFQPNTDKYGQPPMNFNFSGQLGSGPVAFVGNSGDRSKGMVNAGVPYVGSRCTGSPSVTYQSCPDLASPMRQQVPEPVVYSRNVSQRLSSGDETVASLSAPTTPSKRAGAWSANAQRLRSPVSAQAQMQWRAHTAVPNEHDMPVQLSHQNIVVNNHRSNSAYVSGYHTNSQRFDPRIRAHSSLISSGHGRAAFHSADQSGGQFTPPAVNPYSGNMQQVPAPRNRFTMSDAASTGEGTPLTENAFLRSVVDDESRVFRSHPLFPLLRDIIITDMNFHTSSFPFQLIANLPSDFNRLVQNYIERNPRLASVTVTDQHVDSVVVDALSYAHAALIGKIEARKMKERNGATAHRHQSAIEDFCDTFERTVKPVVDEYATAADRQVGPLTTNSTQFHGQPHRTLCNTTELSSSLPYGLNSHPQPAVRLPQRDAGRLLQHSHSLPSSPHKLRPQQLSVQSPLCVYPAGGSFADLSYNMAEKTTTNRSKVLPKEAVTLMTSWLREHQDNPYPNDDEKEALIASTRLTMNQINYWFTNARRRLLPKWTVQRQIDEQDQKLHRSHSLSTQDDVIVV